MKLSGSMVSLPSCMMSAWVRRSRSTSSGSGLAGMPSTHSSGCHSIRRYPTLRRYPHRASRSLAPFQFVLPFGGGAGFPVLLSSSRPASASRLRNSSMVMTLSPSCSTAIESRWKKSLKLKSFFPLSLLRRYIFFSGGSTRVRPVACAKTNTVSIAMRMLFQPPRSGSNVRYFARDSSSVAAPGGGPKNGLRYAESDGMSDQNTISDAISSDGPPYLSHDRPARTCWESSSFFSSLPSCPPPPP
mmetsp:Transcript_43422/g.132124  ORF Transcript_43422/g.132124 Transcript_43422/m.132124 type:complete len:244 (-) Transcript_43422:403-1134(-)